MVQAVGIRSSSFALTSSGGRRARTYGLGYRQEPIQILQRQALYLVQRDEHIRIQSDENVPFEDRCAACLDDNAPRGKVRHTVSSKYVVCDARVRAGADEYGSPRIIMDFAAEERCGGALSEVDPCRCCPDDFDVDDRQFPRYTDSD